MIKQLFSLKYQLWKQKGFTLLEVIISIVIMSGALILLSNTWGGAFKSLKKGKQKYEISVLLERKLTEIELEFRNKPLAEIPDDRDGDFGKDYQNIRWKLKSKKFEFPDITSMLKQRDQGSDGMSEMIFKQLTELINKSIKEVQVTILVKEGKITKEYSAVSLFVDYDQNILSGMGGGNALPGGLNNGTGSGTGGSPGGTGLGGK